MGISFIAVWMVMAPSGLEQAGKVDPPGEEAQAKAEQQIRAVFKDEYAQKTPGAWRSLSRVLLKQAGDTKDEVAVRYVLFRESADLAARSGDTETLLGALDALSEEFKVDPVALRAPFLLKAEPAVPGIEGQKWLVESLLEITRLALAQDQFDWAMKASQAALATAKRSKDLAWVSRTDGAVKSVAEAKTAWDTARTAERVLAASPEDPAAHEIRGEYLCFIKGQWEQGLVHLSKGTDPALKALAIKERALPTETPAKVEIADGWWDLSTAEKSPLRKRGQRTHARTLYTEVLPSATGLLRIKIETRLTEGISSHGPLEAPVEPTRQGLVAWWKCDEGKGNSIADASGAGHDGTLTNVVWASARRGAALKFDGSTSYVSCLASNLPPTHGPQTITWWHYRPAPNTTGNLIVLSSSAQFAAVQIALGKESVGVWKLGGANLLTAQDSGISTWTHGAYSFDGKTHSLYVNGKLEATSGAPPQNGVPDRCELGRWWGTTGSAYYNGMLRQVRVYSRALSASEIAVLAASRE